jgi:hypothetical protein
MHEISEVWNILDDIYEMDRNDNEEREYKISPVFKYFRLISKNF